jgi:hypothetical protein
MIAKSFTRAKRVVSARRAVRMARFTKYTRARSERRAAHRLLALGMEDIPPVIRADNHVGAAAWVIS